MRAGLRLQQPYPTPRFFAPARSRVFHFASNRLCVLCLCSPPHRHPPHFPPIPSSDPPPFRLYPPRRCLALCSRCVRAHVRVPTSTSHNGLCRCHRAWRRCSHDACCLPASSRRCPPHQPLDPHISLCEADPRRRTHHGRLCPTPRPPRSRSRARTPCTGWHRCWKHQQRHCCATRRATTCA